MSMKFFHGLLKATSFLLFFALWFDHQALAQGPQPPLIEWEKTFGGTNWDLGYSVHQTSDGGYIIAGVTTIPYVGQSANVYLIKADSFNNKQWEKTFGGTNDDWGHSVYQTGDGGYIIAGQTISYGAGGDVYLIRVDSSGDKEWQKIFGGTNVDSGHSVYQTGDGGYIITGYTESYGAGWSDVYLIKADSSGNLVWEKTFGGTNYDEGRSVQQTSDGGYIITGWTNSYGAGGRDVYLIKTDFLGNKQWEKTFGGTGDDDGFSVQQTSDGGYIIAGYTYSYGAGSYDVYLIKADSSGNKEWEKTFGGTSYDYDYSVLQTNDGGYIITGYTYSFGAGDSDVYLIKADSSGNKEWEKTFGGTGYDGGHSVQQTRDGGYIIAGGTYSYGAGGDDVYLIKLTPATQEATLVVPWYNDSGGALASFITVFNPTSNSITLTVTYTGGGEIDATPEANTFIIGLKSAKSGRPFQVSGDGEAVEQGPPHSMPNSLAPFGSATFTAQVPVGYKISGDTLRMGTIPELGSFSGIAPAFSQ